MPARAVFVLLALACRLLAQPAAPPFVSLSAASYSGQALAPESIASGFGSSLAAATVSGDASDSSTVLDGINVRVVDSSGGSHAAPLYFVSPSQINYVVPREVRPGPATVQVRSGENVLASGAVQIAPVAPGLFTATQSGSGLASARSVVVSAAGVTGSQLTFDCPPPSGRCIPVPIRTDGSGRVFLELYGTGIRGRSSLSAVNAAVNGLPAEVLYAGPQNQYPGLDQVNIAVPASALNAGLVQVAVTVDGTAANAVSVQLGGSAQTAPVTVSFNPLRPEIGPFPSDALTVPDPSQKTGLRVSLPLPDCAVERTTCETYRLLNEYDGFNLQPRVAVRFSSAVDPNTLRNGLRIVWLENLTNEERGLQPAGHVTGLERLIFDPETNTVYGKPDEPMDQHRRYALVVTTAVRDPLGNPVTPDPAYTACVTAPATDYCMQLAQVQPLLSQAVGQVAAASVFTTLSATSHQERARTVVQNTPVNLKRVATANLAGFAAATLRLQTGVNPVAFEDFTVPLPALITAGADRVHFGAYTSPNFLDARQIMPAVPTNAPLPAPASLNEIAFHAYVPAASKPPSGYPVILFGHGLGDSSFGAPTVVAGSFAKAGFATLVINAAGHGSGPQTELVLTNFIGQRTTIPVPGRGVDLDNDGRIGSREGCLLQTLGLVVRDCLRQTAIDLMQLTRAIRMGIDLDGDGTVDLDRNRIYYAGQSLGALYGTIFTAVEPDVRAAALNVGGATVADIAVFSDQIRPLARDILAMHAPPILNAGNDFNASPVLRGEPVKINTVPGAIELQNYIELLDWLHAPGDPISYAPHLRLSPLPGVPEKRTLFQIARGDRTVPNPTSSNLIRQAGGQNATVLYRHDVARASSAGLPENPHAFLVGFRSIPGFAVAQAVQGQIAGFFAADGVNIPNANSTALSVLFLGRDVFERPTALPQDLGF